MIWTTPKSAKDVQLDGVTIEIDKKDTSFLSVTLTDKSGHKFRTRYENYSLSLEVPQPPETKDASVLSGNVMGLPVRETFEDDYKAHLRKAELTQTLDEGQFDLKIESEPVEQDIPFLPENNC